MNDCMVSVNREHILILRPPLVPMTKEDALRLAAWIVALADDSANEERFAAVLNAVKNT